LTTRWSKPAGAAPGDRVLEGLEKDLEKEFLDNGAYLGYLTQL
jgi:hypothetical protein